MNRLIHSSALGHAARAAAWFGAIVLLFGLALFAYAGTYTRFWADDYCYSATIQQLGLIRGMGDWYLHNGNRLSTLVPVALSDLAGWQGIRLVPAAVLGLWAGAWLFFLNRLRGLLRIAAAWPWLVLVAAVQVYFGVLLAPDRLQTIYWRMGIFHYTLPMPLLLINLGLLAGLVRRPDRAIWVTALVSGFLGFFAAGLSETFAALQTGLLLAALLGIWLFAPKAVRGRLTRLLAAPLLGSLLMMAIMMRAPANAWRQAVMPPPDNLLLVIPYSLRYAVDFIVYALRGQVTPFAVLGLSMGLIGLLAAPVSTRQVAPIRWLAGAAAALVVTYGLIVCSFAPSAYAGLAYPAGRALMPGAFILLAGLGTAAVLAGLAVRGWMPDAGQAWLTAAAVVLLLLVSLYPFRAVSAARSDISQLSVRAARWDDRHAVITRTVAAGNLDVQVREVDVVQGLEDMGPNSNAWINACATVLYHAHSLTATP